MNLIQKLPLALILSCSSLVFAQQLQKISSPKEESHNHEHETRPDSHAPIGIMGDHTHKKGEIMFSYRAMLMSMEGLLDGSNDINREDTGYNVNPDSMTMQMHMLGFMYAPSDRITLMAMYNYLANSMDLHNNPMDIDFTTKSSGLGDFKIGALINLINKENIKIHANVSLSTPIGDIEQRDDIPNISDFLLAYNMQLSSGTWDPTMGFTYVGNKGLFGWGVQSLFTFRTGTNERDYALGEKGEASLWGSVTPADFISISTRVKYTQTTAINGADEEMNSLLMPLFDTTNSGRKQLDLNLGSNIIIKSLDGLRVGIEVGLPVYQDVNGIQMKNEIAGTIGVQYAL